MNFVYFANPMCSWCWGFSPAIQEIKKSLPENDIRLVLTPFRIDTTEPMDETLRNYVLGQWQKVHKTTGQPFDFRFTVPDGFIYNTSLVCLAIKAFSRQLPQLEFEYLHALQHAFYTENQDLTNQEVLVNAANKFAVNEILFVDDLNGRALIDVLKQDFILCKQLAVQSYPTLMLEKSGSYTVLATGHCSYEELATRIAVQAID